MHRIVVDIEMPHIRAGCPDSPTQCALALALRAHPHVHPEGGHTVHVGATVVVVRACRYDHYLRLDRDGRRLVEALDGGGVVGPCQVVLAPAWSEDRAGRGWARTEGGRAAEREAIDARRARLLAEIDREIEAESTARVAAAARLRDGHPQSAANR